MNRSLKLASFSIVAFALTGVASAQWNSYVIRNSPQINDLGGGQTEFIIDAGGEKAALGSAAIDGRTFNQIINLSIDRLDDASRFSAGSGPAVAPYVNFWITDGLGNWAVASNEPSNPEWDKSIDEQHNITWANLQNKIVKFYEHSEFGSIGTAAPSWLGLPSQPNYTFGDIADVTIQAPDAATLAGLGYVGSGAPRELGTNMAYGVNWVFGDTLSNYVSGDDGYIVANANVEAVPEPTTMAALGLGALALLRRRKK
ncbi:MAG: PEP-CTERM sorting domain-containing protein [Fimbriimonadaceae bacterium]